MQINGLKCEMCSTLHNFDGFRDRAVWIIPDGWFGLFKTNPDKNIEWMHFCSAGCLGLWVREYRGLPAVEPLPAKNNPSFPPFPSATTLDEKEEDRKFWRDN